METLSIGSRYKKKQNKTEKKTQRQTQTEDADIREKRQRPFSEITRSGEPATAYEKASRHQRSHEPVKVSAQHDASVLNLTSDTRQTRWRQEHPKRYRAHVAVGKALARGELEKQPCEVCGTTHGRIDAHHDNYDKPLSVRWLCRLHHVQLHKGGEDMFGERKSA